MKQLDRTRFLKGFTLFECLLSLLLFSTICLLGSGYLNYIQIISRQLQDTCEKEWHVFLIQMETELKDCTLLAVHPEMLLLEDKKRGYSMQIEFKKNKIVKTANGGYQPLLMNVASAHFTQEKELIYLKIVFENTQIHEAMLPLLKQEAKL